MSASLIPFTEISSTSGAAWCALNKRSCCRVRNAWILRKASFWSTFISNCLIILPQPIPLYTDPSLY